MKSSNKCISILLRLDCGHTQNIKTMGDAIGIKFSSKRPEVGLPRRQFNQSLFNTVKIAGNSVLIIV